MNTATSHYLFQYIPILFFLFLSHLRLTLECSTLTITGVAPEDEGTYTCGVQNDNDPQYEDISETPLKLEYCSECLTIC